ncbi:hypothetical protein FRB96_002065 [Tulasnella sp. 330]|nr:hypothetical protein FRB96_002065 [Tulasnella sp. 330]KAG8875931.1 hypothetical protein FRB98_007528 [Tulasnella sp. 332]KAG8881120.1 hypothetical protein FRB97_000172 [Tulasnella sp. 331]
MYDDYEDDEESIVSMTDFLAGPKDGKAAAGAIPSVPIRIPTSGQALYEYRRAQWLRPTSSRVAAVGSITLEDERVSRSHARLEAIVNQQGVEEDDGVWRQYLSAVHESLVGGKRLKKGIKLNIAVKILKAGWLRDGTWDTAAAASFGAPSNGPSTASSGTAVDPPPRLSDVITPLIPTREPQRGLRALIAKKMTPWDMRSTTTTTNTPTASTSAFTIKSAPSMAWSQSTLKLSTPQNRPRAKSAISKVLPSFAMNVRKMFGQSPAEDEAAVDGREVTGMLDMMDEAPFPYRAQQKTSHSRNRSASVF